jgi:methionyl aminopeptidase
MQNRVKTKPEIDAIKDSGKMLATVLQKIEDTIEAGMCGIDIDNLANRELKSLGGVPAFLGYQGFPASICVSVNDEVVHGIPGDKQFADGDLVSFDFGVTYKGMITDAARTVSIGVVDDVKQNLIKTTRASLDTGIAVVKPGCKIGDISSSIQNVLEKSNLGIVRELVGHGVGHHVHEEPEIPNYGEPGTGPVLKSGMTIAVEPMATLGGWQVVIDPDGWTIRTRDGSLAAHFEDTLLVTDTGVEILTRL